MSDYKDIFRTKEHHNWCKLWKGVYILRDGLIEFVMDELTSFHQNLLGTLPAATTCTTCLTSNALPCPSPTICRLKHGKCNYHTTKAAGYKVCTTHDKIRDAISNEHRFHSPSWLNSHAENWTTSSWEIAKCFMPKDGYIDKVTADETDLNGLLAVIINCKRFQNVFAINLSVKNNICVQVRDIVKTVRHFERMQVNITDVDLNSHLDMFINLLDDSKALQGHPKSSEARTRLKQLKTDQLSITTTDAKQILDDALKQLNEKKLEDVQAMKSTVLKAQQDTETVLQRLRRAALNQERKSAAALRRNLRLIEATSSKEQKKIEDLASTIYPSHDYHFKKNELKDDLVNFYKERRSTLPLSPLMQVRDAPLSDFYVGPKVFQMAKNNDVQATTSVPGDNKRHTGRMLSYNEIFYDGQRQRKNIYIQGEPGTGKSSFCNKLALDWCDVTSSDVKDDDERQNQECSAPSTLQTSDSELSDSDSDTTRLSPDVTFYVPESDAFGNLPSTSESDSDEDTLFSEDNVDKLLTDTDALRTFNFLFLVSLRDSRGIDCDVDDMIQHQIVSELSSGHNYHPGFVASVLSKERCLVILDGLDEWVHHEKQGYFSCTRPLSSRSVPHRKVRQSCTILTTTRPWKLNEVQIKDSDIDILMEITGTSDNKALVRKALKCVNERFSTSKQAWRFFMVLRQKNVKHFMSIPVIAMQLLCLWHQDRPFGKSRCDIYANMIEMLLQMFSDKYQNDHDVQEKLKPVIQAGGVQVESSQMPHCFVENINCKNYWSVLTSLGNLAYHALLSPGMESAMVFGETVLTKHLSKLERKIALDSGILSQSKSMQYLLRSEPKYFFIHKTFQEFLAALYLATLNEPVQDNTKCWFQSCINNMSGISEIFLFICGMNGELAGTLSEYINEKLVDVSNYGSYKFESKVKKIQSLIVRGYQESTDNELEGVNVALRCVVLDEYNEGIHQKLLTLIQQNQNKNSIHYLSIDTTSSELVLKLTKLKHPTLRTFCIGHSCVNYDKCVDLSESKNLKHLSVGKQSVRKQMVRFGAIMRCTVMLNTSCLKYCYICHLNQSATKSVLNAVQASVNKMETLEIQWCEIPNWFVSSFFPSCLNLKNLYLIPGNENVSQCSASSDDGDLLASVALSSSSLENVHIYNISESVEKAVLKGLATGAPHLKTLALSFYSHSGLLCQTLSNLPSLRSLTIDKRNSINSGKSSDQFEDIMLDTRSLDDVFIKNACSAVESVVLRGLCTGAPRLKELRVFLNEHNMLLFKALPNLRNLKTLELGNTTLDNSMDINLPDSIERIFIENFDMSNEQLRQIIERIVHLKHHVSVDILHDGSAYDRLVLFMKDLNTFEELQCNALNKSIFKAVRNETVIKLHYVRDNSNH